MLPWHRERKREQSNSDGDWFGWIHLLINYIQCWLGKGNQIIASFVYIVTVDLQTAKLVWTVWLRSDPISFQSATGKTANGACPQLRVQFHWTKSTNTTLTGQACANQSRGSKPFYFTRSKNSGHACKAPICSIVVATLAQIKWIFLVNIGTNEKLMSTKMVCIALHAVYLDRG